MKKPVLEVIRFEEPDIIATSGLGMTMNYFGDQVPNNGEFTFFGRSSGDKIHNAHEENIVSEFNSYYGRDWKDLVDITLNFDGGYDNLGVFVRHDTNGDGLLDDSKFNRTYTYENGQFYMRSN